MSATVKSSVPVLVATITVKATGKKFYVYRVPSQSAAGVTYDVCVYRGLAVDCSCPSRKHSHGKACKHMRDFKAPGQDQAVTSPVVKRDLLPTPAAQTFTAPLAERGALNGNRGFSLMRR